MKSLCQMGKWVVQARKAARAGHPCQPRDGVPLPRLHQGRDLQVLGPKCAETRNLWALDCQGAGRPRQPGRQHTLPHRATSGAKANSPQALSSPGAGRPWQPGMLRTCIALPASAGLLASMCVYRLATRKGSTGGPAALLAPPWSSMTPAELLAPAAALSPLKFPLPPAALPAAAPAPGPPVSSCLALPSPPASPPELACLPSSPSSVPPGSAAVPTS